VRVCAAAWLVHGWSGLPGQATACMHVHQADYAKCGVPRLAAAEAEMPTVWCLSCPAASHNPASAIAAASLQSGTVVQALVDSMEGIQEWQPAIRFRLRLAAYRVVGPGSVHTSDVGSAYVLHPWTDSCHCLPGM
jgi:hypothetical protein